MGEEEVLNAHEERLSSGSQGAKGTSKLEEWPMQSPGRTAWDLTRHCCPHVSPCPCHLSKDFCTPDALKA